MTRLCVAIFVNDLATAERDIARAAEAGADLVELRIDPYHGDEDALRDLIARAVVPCVVTCRAEYEGGQSSLPDRERIAYLERVAPNASYVDIELQADRSGSSFVAMPRDARPGLILSSHDFQGRPDRLYNVLAEMNAAPGDVNKIVWTARSVRDNCEAFEVLKSRQKPTIALCMGEAGLLSRVLAKKFGAFLTFAALETGAGTAPGQVSIADMKRLYRWDAINPKTKVYGVVGSPIMHSMSPAIHNASFDAVGHDGVYLPMLVEAGYESFKAFMETFLNCEGLDLAGLSVTIPHKENCLRYLKEKGAEVEELAERIGAVNTVLIDRAVNGAPDGAPRLRGKNTDYAAILDSITSKLNIKREGLADYRVAVIGAGGTGRTAVAALAHYGATVVIYNRTPERAHQLAAEFNGRRGKVVVAAPDKLCDSCCQIYLNASSIGMYPKVDESPFGDRPPQLTRDTLVFDSVYNPIKTKFLRQAEAAGAKTVSGVDMFVRQAQGQFESWTNKPAPTDLMRSVVETRLARK